MSDCPNGRWQSRITDIPSAIREVYRTKEFADVILRINKQDPIKAHKWILAACSSVFKEKFLDSGYEEITVEDESITPVGVEILLRFIYTNEIGTDDKKSIIEAYLAAAYFREKGLCTECVKRCESWTITVDDVWQLLDAGFAILMLRVKCILFIHKNACKALAHPSFLRISYGCLDGLLDSGALKSVPVMLCIKRIMEWAASHHTKPVDYQLVRREFENQILGKLRIETLNAEELNVLMNNYEGLLTPKDILQILLYSKDKNAAHLPDWCSPSSLKHVTSNILIN